MQLKTAKINLLYIHCNAVMIACVQQYKEVGFHRVNTRCSPPPPVRWLLRSPSETACPWQGRITAIFRASSRCCSAPSRTRRRPLTPPRRAHRPGAAPPVRTLRLRRRRQGRQRREDTACSSRRTTSWALRTSVSWRHDCYSAPSNGRETYRSFPTYRSLIRFLCFCYVFVINL